MVIINLVWFHICFFSVMADVLLQSQFNQAKITPFYFRYAPKDVLEVYYGDNEVTVGELISPTDVTKQPDVKLKPQLGFCTVLLIGDLFPLQVANVVTVLQKAQVLHWLVGNIPGCKDVDDGEVIARYFQSVPPAPPGLKPYRYVFLVFGHEQELDFIPFFKDTIFKRIFSTKIFMKKYDLETADQGTFFYSQYITTSYSTKLVNKVATSAL